MKFDMHKINVTIVNSSGMTIKTIPKGFNMPETYNSSNSVMREINTCFTIFH